MLVTREATSRLGAQARGVPSGRAQLMMAGRPTAAAAAEWIEVHEAQGPLPGAAALSYEHFSGGRDANGCGRLH